MLTVQTITDETRLSALVPEWDRLDASLSPRTPFGSHWCVAWWRHFARRKLAVRDAMRVFVVRDRAGTLVAVAPMMLTLRPAIGPFRTRELQFFGADAYVTEIRGPVCRPEDVPAVARALSAHLEGRSSEWDWVQWRGLRQDGVAPPSVADGEAFADHGVRLAQAAELTDHFLALPESWEAFRAALPRNIKESLRKCYNALARDGHAFTLRVVSEPDAADAALRTFLDLHRGRAERTGTVDHIDVFAQVAARRFLLDYGTALSRRGGLRVFQLVIGEAVVATRIGILMGDELYLYYSGYDTDWGRYSVMTTVVAEAIRWAIGQGLSVVNLSTGTDVSKMRWRPQQVRYVGGYQTAPSFRARLAFAAMDRLRRRGRRAAQPPAVAAVSAGA